jgi:hypothetical protein
MGSGNEGGYAHWTKKANMLRHDLGKGLGYGKGTTIHLIEGSTTQIKVEEIGI